MISSLEVRNFRGIREGTLDGLAPLTVLLGPNGAGKSALLEALLIATHPEPAEAICRAVAHRRDLRRGAQWLLRRPEAKPARLTVGWPDGGHRTTQLTLFDPDHQAITVTSQRGPDPLVETRVRFEVDGQVRIDGPTQDLVGPPAVTLVDLAAGRDDLPDVLSALVRSGRKPAAVSFLQPLVPGIEDLVVLTELGDPELHALYAWGSVPLAVAGDGVAALAALTCTVLAEPLGLLLIEEPEIHQHPRGLDRLAELLAGLVGTGQQTVIATHSIELVDGLVQHLPAELTTQLALFTVRLSDGQLRHDRLAGEMVRFARAEVGDDLR
ncbi:MAG: AAA family ATPase [Fimbriimonadaceae bacterium]|nr:AAA family ATPase [Fimbriimonadaceae bacterium]